MTKYLLNRILRGLVSVVIVVIIVMMMIYMFLDRELIFAQDPVWSKQKFNQKQTYQMQQWERYGYVDYVPYADYLTELVKNNEITQETKNAVSKFGDKAEQDSAEVAEYVKKFTEYYESKGYEVVRLPAIMKGNTKKYQDGGEPKLYAYKDVSIINRVFDYFGGLITIDNINNAEGVADEDRGLTFTFFDPAYGGEKFSPAIMGNGTTHKYLLYFDSSFPYVHQNLISINLGTSYSVNKGVDIFDTMTQGQGALSYSTLTYPSGVVAERADDLHSLTYVKDSFENGTVVTKELYVDDYTNTTTSKTGLSKMGYSFIIGIISVFISYLIGIPLGTVMALKKDKLVDKLGTIYIIFVIAVPSLAYIFLFKSIGGKMGLPTTFDTINPTWLMYILPVISLALPSVASLMKWLRRYMIDQMNSDYVKFARSGGLSEGEIFSKHVLKNAIIPIVHGIPGSMLGALVGAIITERVYVIPGAGNLLTQAINYYDNGVIVGVTLFYALLSVISIILGDVLMSLVDPRISFTTKAR